MVDPELPERVDDRVDEGRRGADRPGLAGALDPQRIGAAWHDVVGEFQRRQVVGAIGPPRSRAEPAGPQWLYGALDVWMNSEQLTVIKLEVAPAFGASESEATRYETTSGIHVGSTIGAVEKSYPAAKCATKTEGCVLNSGTRSTLFMVAKSNHALTGSTRVLLIEIS